MVKRLTTSADVMKEAGTDPDSSGCEVCKPAVASILSSLYNRYIMDKDLHGLQDTNDRYLGNIQRNETFSVVVSFLFCPIFTAIVSSFLLLHHLPTRLAQHIYPTG